LGFIPGNFMGFLLLLKMGAGFLLFLIVDYSE